MYIIIGGIRGRQQVTIVTLCILYVCILRSVYSFDWHKSHRDPIAMCALIGTDVRGPLGWPSTFSTLAHLLRHTDTKPDCALSG